MRSVHTVPLVLTLAIPLKFESHPAVGEERPRSHSAHMHGKCSAFTCRVSLQPVRFQLTHLSTSRATARDNIFGGQSTFLLELSETAALLNCATRRSLVHRC